MSDVHVEDHEDFHPRFSPRDASSGGNHPGPADFFAEEGCGLGSAEESQDEAIPFAQAIFEINQSRS
jgi:hypothetical protein